MQGSVLWHGVPSLASWQDCRVLQAVQFRPGSAQACKLRVKTEKTVPRRFEAGQIPEPSLVLSSELANSPSLRTPRLPEAFPRAGRAMSARWSEGPAFFPQYSSLITSPASASLSASGRSPPPPTTAPTSPRRRRRLRRRQDTMPTANSRTSTS